MILMMSEGLIGVGKVCFWRLGVGISKCSFKSDWTLDTSLVHKCSMNMVAVNFLMSRVGM
jgi:hypothetical protein